MNPFLLDNDKTLYTREELEKLVKKCDDAMQGFSFRAMEAISNDCERHAELAKKRKIEELKDEDSEDFVKGFSRGCAFMAQYLRDQWKLFKESNRH